MAILTVGPNSLFATIAAAMLAAGPNDTIRLESGYRNETATVRHSGMTVSGDATSTGIDLRLATGIATFTLTGTAPINVHDASDGNGIVGNDGNNIITVTAGADAVAGGLGTDRLIVDYHLATGAVTGDSTSNFTEAGGGGRLVTITDGTFENFTILTGSGADTITTGSGDDIIRTGEGAGTITAGQGANIIIGGSGADTITALDGGNFINGGDGTNTITSGSGNDVIRSGTGADTIVAGGGNDVITVQGGADTSASGAGDDRLVVDYSVFSTAVTGGVTSGNPVDGYTGQIADSAGNSVGFQNTENFTITTGSGNDIITTGDGIDRLSGGAGNDLLNGGGGNDHLLGGLGNDVLTGGAGRDVLTGNGGADRFDFNAVAETGVTVTTRDTITDFVHAVDKIDLSTIDAIAGGGTANDAFTFMGTGAFNGAGEVRVVQSGLHTIVQISTDADTAPEASILLLNFTASTLTAGDFIL